MKIKYKSILLILFLFTSFLTKAQITGIKVIANPCDNLTIDLQALGTSFSPFFSWNFGDPLSGVNNTVILTGSSSVAFPTHTFTSSGVYNVCVSFQEPGFPIFTICRNILVGFCCSGQIVFNNPCSNNIPFSIVSNDQIFNINWNFGDIASGSNNTSIALNPTHTFSTNGTFLVTALVNASCGNFTATASVNVNNTSITPTFNPIPAFCTGTTAPILPTTSLNGIIGTWSPAIVSNTTNGTYTFTPNAGQCATNATLNTTVSTSITPNFNPIPAFCAGTTAPILPSTSLNRITGTWSPAIVSNITNGTYTFTPNAGQCALNTIIDITINPNIATNFDFAVSEPFSDYQFITIISNNPGNFLYQLDSDILQTSNVFQNVSSGIHSVTIYDVNGCSLPFTINDIIIIKYPKFFTPNSDGYNDTWNITDLFFQQNSQIFIFDRYGKLLKQIFPFGAGWDGRYNNSEMPSTDYWFTVTYEYKGVKKKFKSHFALKR